MCLEQGKLEFAIFIEQISLFRLPIIEVVVCVQERIYEICQGMLEPNLDDS